MTDADTNIVFVSDLLARRNPVVHAVLSKILGSQLRQIPNTKDIWCRDYMPVQVAADRFIQFRYEPDYLRDDPQLRTVNGAGLLGWQDCLRSDLVIDGGNVVRFGNVAILTDKIYRENPRIERPRLREALRTLLSVDRLIIVPKEPFDRIGHVDGMVRFVNENTLLVNDYTKVDAIFGDRLAKALRGFEMIPIPYCPSGKVIEGIDSACGVYTNFLHVGNLVCVPVYGQPADDKALTVVHSAFPDYRIIPIPSVDLATGGGVLNCVTWNIQMHGA